MQYATYFLQMSSTEQFGERIREAGGEALCSQTDVSKEEPVRELVERTIDSFGTIDILANVVGIAGPTKDVWQMSLAEWQQTLAVNLDSAFLGCKYVLPEMIRKRYGRIINFSSGSGKQPLSHRTPYTTSKMGILGFTRTLAADVGRYNITVNAICPGSHEERGVELERARSEYRGEAFDEEAVRNRVPGAKTERRPGRTLVPGRRLHREGRRFGGGGGDRGLSGVGGRSQHDGTGHQLGRLGNVVRRAAYGVWRRAYCISHKANENFRQF